MRISILIVSYNVREHLRACLESIPMSLAADAVSRAEGGSGSQPDGEQSAEVAASRDEIIIIDNASRDGSVEMAAALVSRAAALVSRATALVSQMADLPAVRLIANSENRGFGAANNQGIALAQGQYILFLNADTLLPPGSLAQLVHFMDAHPQVGACSPQLRLPDGQPQPFAFGDDPSLSHLLRRGLNRVLLQRSLHRWDVTTAQPVDWVSGACLLIRRAALTQVGGFDESFFMYFEDVDLCRRVRAAGWEVWLYPQAAITHIGGQSMKQNPAAQAAYQQSLVTFYRKHYTPPAQWLLRGALRGYRFIRRLRGET